MGPRKNGAARAARRAAWKLLPLILLAAVLAGCTAGRYGGGVYANRWTRFRIEEPGDGWRRVRTRGAGVAFRNEGLGAAIYVDDSCRQFEDAPLPVLANHLFFGFTEVEVEEVREMVLDRRAAHRRVVRGRLDGVRVRVAATVMKKGHCVYDLVYISPPETFERGLAAYEAVVRSFRVER